MASEKIRAALDFKLDLERDFETAARLGGRPFYSAVYSLPQRSPVMWINLNPGGTPDDHQVLSDDQLAHGKHEFWHGHGPTSKATGKFLQKLFDAPLDRLRSVQGTNVAWERSHKGQDIDLRAAAKRAAPLLIRYIQYAHSNTLIFGGCGAFDLFVNVHGARVEKESDVLMGNWGRRKARIFSAAVLNVPELGLIETLTVSHPSRGRRAGVLERCRAHLSNLELPEAIA